MMKYFTTANDTEDEFGLMLLFKSIDHSLNNYFFPAVFSVYKE